MIRVDGNKKFQDKFWMQQREIMKIKKGLITGKEVIKGKADLTENK